MEIGQKCWRITYPLGQEMFRQELHADECAESIKRMGYEVIKERGLFLSEVEAVNVLESLKGE